MTTDLTEQLCELRNSADELNALTDKANDIVRRTEAFLRDECRVGGNASVPVPSLVADYSDEGGPVMETYLDYQRYKGEFRILATLLVDGDPQESKPWGEWQRNVKLASLDVLPELIEKLLGQVRKQVATVQAKVELLDRMIPPVVVPQGRRTSSRKG